jgi:hypothetical protein
MNHTKRTTLGKAVAIVALAAVLMIAAATPLLVTGHNALAFGNKVKVGDTKSKCIQAADDSQHASFGSGSAFNTANNTPTNTQSQTCNAGSTGTG